MSAPMVPPFTQDPETRGFWQAAAEGRLVVRVCGECGTMRHLPRAFCADCGAVTETWVEVEPKGRLHSWTTVTHQVHPGYPAPYTCVLVELDEPAGVRFVGSLPGTPELTLDQPMEGWFDVIEGVPVPQWRPVDQA